MKINRRTPFLKAILLALISFAATTVYAQQTKNIYVIKLHKEIDKSSAKMFTDALKEAQAAQADYCIARPGDYFQRQLGSGNQVAMQEHHFWKCLGTESTLRCIRVQDNASLVT